MKVLVTGVAGQLGHDVMNELEKRGHTAIGVDVAEMDITDGTENMAKTCQTLGRKMMYISTDYLLGRYPEVLSREKADSENQFTKR